MDELKPPADKLEVFRLRCRARYPDSIEFLTESEKQERATAAEAAAAAAVATPAASGDQAPTTTPAAESAVTTGNTGSGEYFNEVSSTGATTKAVTEQSN